MKKVKMVLLSLIVSLSTPAIAQSVHSVARPGMVVGKVSFERREGIVPGTGKSTSYWAVAVRDHGVKYELAHVAGMNAADRPDSVTIQGRVMHDGDRVSIEGTILKIRNDFGLLSEMTIESVN